MNEGLTHSLRQLATNEGNRESDLAARQHVGGEALTNTPATIDMAEMSTTPVELGIDVDLPAVPGIFQTVGPLSVGMHYESLPHEGFNDTLSVGLKDGVNPEEENLEVYFAGDIDDTQTWEPHLQVAGSRNVLMGPDDYLVVTHKGQQYNYRLERKPGSRVYKLKVVSSS